jgi:HNH/Endo VII superfamily nuclease toxin with a HHH motif
MDKARERVPANGVDRAKRRRGAAVSNAPAIVHHSSRGSPLEALGNRGMHALLDRILRQRAAFLPEARGSSEAAAAPRSTTTARRALLAHEVGPVVHQSTAGVAGIQRQPIAIVPREKHADIPGRGDVPGNITDVSITRTEDELIFNQDERYNEFHKTEYGEGWIDIEGGKQQKVQFAYETVRHEPTDPWEKGWTSQRTTILPSEPEYRHRLSPIHVVVEDVVKTEKIVHISPPPPAKKESGGILSSIGGFFKNVGRFFKGVGKAAWNLAAGVWHVVRHPIRTAEGLFNIVRHPIRTLKALGGAIKQRVSAIASGDFEALGQTVGDIAILLLAPEAEAAEGVEAARALEAVEGVEAIEAAKALEAVQVEARAAETAKGASDTVAVETAAGELTELEGQAARLEEKISAADAAPVEDIRGVVTENRDIMIRGEPAPSVTTRPMKAPPGGGPRPTMTGTRKTVTSHKRPTATVEQRPPGRESYGAPEYSSDPSVTTTASEASKTVSAGRTRNVYPDFEPVNPGLTDVALEQTARLSSQTKIPIPADRVLEAPWVGRVRTAAGKKSSRGTSAGLLRNESAYWGEFKKRFPEDYALMGPNRTVTEALAKRYGWPTSGSNSVVGQRLVHHHIENGPLVVALPESLHVGLSGKIHARPTVEAAP